MARLSAQNVPGLGLGAMRADASRCLANRGGKRARASGVVGRRLASARPVTPEVAGSSPVAPVLFLPASLQFTARRVASPDAACANRVPNDPRLAYWRLVKGGESILTSWSASAFISRGTQLMRKLLN